MVTGLVPLWLVLTLYLTQSTRQLMDTTFQPCQLAEWTALGLRFSTLHLAAHMHKCEEFIIDKMTDEILMLISCGIATVVATRMPAMLLPVAFITPTMAIQKRFRI